MLQQDTPEDFVIATGSCYALEDFIALSFEHYGLDWRQHVRIEPALFRPSEISVGRGNPQKARRKLGWSARYRMPEVIRLMIEDLETPGS